MRRQLQTILLVLFTTAKASAWIFAPLGRRKFFGTAGTAVLIGGAAAANAATEDKKKDLFTPAPGSLEGETIVVTGGTTGLGLESVERLAMGGANIILTARSDSKGQAALDKVRTYLQERSMGENVAKVSYKVLDLDDLSMIKAIPETWKDVPKIDVLMNNAGVMAVPDRQLTVDGIERQLQSNHLGHFVLTSVLAPKLSNTARIINVSSAAHQFAGNTGLLSGDSLWKPSPDDYGPWKSYGQSKLANILFTQELQRKADAAGKQWTVVSLHPGAVTTDLGRNMMGEQKYEEFKQGKGSPIEMGLAKAMALFLKTVPEGATTQVFLAARAEKNQDARGKYYIDCKARPLSPFATDEEAARRLWKESEERAGVKFQL